jgi:HipA-like protein
MKAKVYRNEWLAGILEKQGRKYVFRYTDEYFQDPEQPAISLTLPKRRQEYESEELFAFFFNLLPEGANKRLQCRELKIDEKDYFSLLLAVGGQDTIGAVRVVPA